MIQRLKAGVEWYKNNELSENLVDTLFFFTDSADYADIK